MIPPVLELLRNFLCLARSSLPFVREDRAHRHEIEEDQRGRIETNPSKCRQAVPCDQSDAGDANQQQSEADRQCVALVGPRADGFWLNRIHQRQDDEVEHAAAEYIAQCDVRQGGECCGTESGEQLRKARGRGEQDDADPASTQTRLFSESPYRARRTSARTMTSAVAANWTQIIGWRSHAAVSGCHLALRHVR